MTVDDWRQVLNVNLSGAFQMTKAVLEHMIERGSGRIVNISSVIGETGNVGQANYAASKAGLFGFTKSLALEMAQRGITVNCVAPGFIGTEMVEAIPEAALDKGDREDPAAPPWDARRVARVVRFLLEDESSYITGACIRRQRRARHVAGSVSAVWFPTACEGAGSYAMPTGRRAASRAPRERAPARRDRDRRGVRRRAAHVSETVTMISTTPSGPSSGAQRRAQAASPIVCPSLMERA